MTDHDHAGPQGMDPLRQRALEAEAAGDWSEAARLWGECYRTGDRTARLQQALCLHQAGRHAIATRLALGQLSGVRDADSAVLDTLRSLLQREAADQIGTSAALIERTLSGRPGLAPAYRKLRILQFHAIQKLDDAVMAECRELLDAGPGADTDAETRRLALTLLWVRHGASLSLLERMRRALAPDDRADLELRLLGALGAEAEVRALVRARPALVAEAMTMPVLPDILLAEPGLVADGPEREQLEEAAGRFRRAVQVQTRLWARLRDPGTRLAVVGNAPCELGLGRGAEIDGHDIVVRFNRFSLADEHVPDYGRRLSVIVRSGADRPAYETHMSPDVDTIISGIRPDMLWRKWEVFNRLAGLGHPLSWFPDDITTALLDRLHSRPSSGLYFLLCLRHFRPDLRGVDFYGFAFTDQIGPDAGPSHYFDRSPPALRHNWAEERRLYEALLAERAAGRSPGSGTPPA